jgi:hypothetical protein
MEIGQGDGIGWIRGRRMGGLPQSQLLTDSLDELVWTGNLSMGVMTTKNAYDTIASKI